MSEQGAMLDVVFPVSADRCPRDYRALLADALAAAAPWLAADDRAGPHPLNLVQGSGDPALVSKRARLVLRVARAQARAAHALAGQTLDIGGHPLRLGEPSLRELLMHNTLYAQLVAADADDEAEFVARTEAELAALGVRCRPVCGRRQSIRTPRGALVGFSLMLHGLTAPESLRLLESGVGEHRRLGCGVFVAHRSAAAVGF